MRTVKSIVKVLGVSFTSVALAFTGATSVFASPTSAFSQVISAGTLTTDIRDASNVSVSSPSVAMTAKTASFTCYSGGTASTGTLGTNTQRLYVDNPSAANNGWVLSIAAATPTALWAGSSATSTFDFNDPGGSGCTDGGDTDVYGGQMTVNPSVGTLTADCTSCTTANISKGSSTAFNEGTTDSITVLNAAAASDDSGRWYLTGVAISQTIPADQRADTYSISLTLSVVAS